METSAKTAQNVNEMFDKLTKRMMISNRGQKATIHRPPLPIRQASDENH